MMAWLPHRPLRTFGHILLIRLQRLVREETPEAATERLTDLEATESQASSHLDDAQARRRQPGT